MSDTEDKAMAHLVDPPTPPPPQPEALSCLTYWPYRTQTSGTTASPILREYLSPSIRRCRFSNIRGNITQAALLTPLQTSARGRVRGAAETESIQRDCLLLSLTAQTCSYVTAGVNGDSVSEGFE